LEETRYLDFDLSLEKTGAGSYRARVLASPAGMARAEFTLPFSPIELENFILKVGRTRRGVRRLESPEMEAAKEFGGRLFKSVFTDEVQSVLRQSLDQTRQQGVGLRLRLRLNDAPELVNLPWEYLYNPNLNRFLSLSVNTPLVRYLELPEQIKPLPVEPPLRALVMIASPKDYPPLDVEHEWANLKQALSGLESGGALVVDRLEGATALALQYALRRQDYHIFHFIGHGGFDEHAQDGVLLLEDEAGRGRALSGQYLGALLHDEETLRLVVLNACEGARTGTDDPFAGAAQSLVQQGLPAVIAMQFEVTDQAAVTFSREFYSAVADGYPVDAALAEARKGIFATGNDVEWGTPVLYMRLPDGKVFDVARPAGKPAAPPPSAGPKDSQEAVQVDQLYVDALGAFYIDNFDKAIGLFQQVVAARPNYLDAAQKLEEAIRQRALSQLYQQSRTAIQAGDWKAALDPLEKLAEQDPGYENAGELLEKVRKQAQLASLYANARKLVSARQWQAAIKVFEQLDALDPAYPDEAGLRATAEAENAAQQAQQARAETYAEALKQFNAGHWPQAIEMFTRLLNSDPNYRDAPALLVKARAKAEAARIQAEAEKTLQEKAEQERLAQEQAEAVRLAEQKMQEAQAAQVQAETERLAAAQAEQVRLAQEKAEAARLEGVKQEEERQAKEKARLEQIAQQKAEKERQALAKAEAKRLARQKAEAQSPVGWMPRPEVAPTKSAETAVMTPLAAATVELSQGAVLPAIEGEAISAAAPSFGTGLLQLPWKAILIAAVVWQIVGFVFYGLIAYPSSDTAGYYSVVSLVSGALCGLGLAWALRQAGHAIKGRDIFLITAIWGASWAIGSLAISYVLNQGGENAYPLIGIFILLMQGVLPGAATTWLLRSIQPGIGGSELALSALGWAAFYWAGSAILMAKLFANEYMDTFEHRPLAGGLITGVLGLALTHALLRRAEVRAQDNATRLPWLGHPAQEVLLVGLGWGLVWLLMRPLFPNVDGEFSPVWALLAGGLAGGLLLWAALRLGGFAPQISQAIGLGAAWALGWGAFYVARSLGAESDATMVVIMVLAAGLPGLVIFGGIGSALVLKFARPSLSGGAFWRIVLGWALALLCGIVLSGLLYIANTAYGIGWEEASINQLLGGVLAGALGASWMIGTLRKSLPELSAQPLRQPSGELSPEHPQETAAFPLTAYSSKIAFFSLTAGWYLLFYALLYWEHEIYTDNLTRTILVGATGGLAAGLGSGLGLRFLGLRLSWRQVMTGTAAWAVCIAAALGSFAYIVTTPDPGPVGALLIVLGLILLGFAPGTLVFFGFVKPTRPDLGWMKAWLTVVGWLLGLVAALIAVALYVNNFGRSGIYMAAGLLAGPVSWLWLTKVLKLRGDASPEK
jgi:outer membrane protein assembly factor BamD (BamD/ComL family)